MKIYERTMRYIELTKDKDGTFTFELDVRNGVTHLNMEETNKNGQEDCHIYVDMVLDEDKWAFTDEWAGMSLDDYWGGAAYFLGLVNENLPPSWFEEKGLLA